MEDVDEKEAKPIINICPHIKFVQFMLIIDFIKFVIGFNGSILLLYGIKTKQPKLFLAWLIFCGLVIFTNFFTILIIRNLNVVNNVLIVVLLSYLFRVVCSYRLQLFEELNNGCPVVAVAFPQEAGVRVFLPTQQPQTAADYIKDDPPPPYPGLPMVASTLSIESQPPPYSVVNPNCDDPTVTCEPSSSSTVQPNTPPEPDRTSLQGRSDDRRLSHSTSTSASELEESETIVTTAESLNRNSPTPPSTSYSCIKISSVESPTPPSTSYSCPKVSSAESVIPIPGAQQSPKEKKTSISDKENKTGQDKENKTGHS